MVVESRSVIRNAKNARIFALLVLIRSHRSPTILSESLAQATTSLEFEYLHRKSRCEMLIGGDDICGSQWRSNFLGSCSKLIPISQ